MASSQTSKRLYLQVLIAIAFGVVLGHFFPAVGLRCQPLGEIFVRLVKMLLAPVVFLTVSIGIAGMGDLKKVGRVGLKATLYFEVLTTVALLLGLLVVRVLQPGVGIHADVSKLDGASIDSYTNAANSHPHTISSFLMDLVPTNVIDAFAKGDVLQVLFFSTLFGLSVAAMGEKGKPLVEFLERFAQAMFGVVGIVMKLAPLGAFGAMAFTVAKFKIGTLLSLGQLMACFYLTCAVFVFVVLGTVTKLAGFSIFRLIRYLRDELLIVLGTSSSESVLPQMLEKLERLGAKKSVVGLVIPAGYSFNLDGTCIYLTMAAMFVAQATDTHLSLGQQLAVLGVLLLTSKGAAGVTGAGFITLAATLSSTHTIPVAGLALILGIDRFMSEARALTNLVGNAVATLVVAKWEGELDEETLRRELG